MHALQIKSKSILLVVSLMFLLPITIMGQHDLADGFRLLENGEFDSARNFFYPIIEDDPNNKTAMICYGRALGLSDNSGAGLEIFRTMNNEYPGDVEVLLNLAEAYLWNKMNESALKIYNDLLNSYPNNFTAMLGRSNSLAGLQRNEEAFKSIREALKINPSHESALLSQKFIGLAFAADIISKKQDPEAALNLMSELLQSRTRDIDLLGMKAKILISLDSLSAAEDVYQSMGLGTIDALIGISQIRRSEGNNDEALKLAKEAYYKSLIRGNHLKMSRSITHYHSALLWNKEFYKAEELHAVMDTIMDSKELMAMSKAEFEMYTADYLEGLDIYSRQLNKTPESFGANLGTAHSLHALGMDLRAYQQAFKTLKYYPGQKDTYAFITQLNALHSPYINYSTEVLKDSDNNLSINHRLLFENSIHPQLRITLGSIYRKTGDFGSNNTLMANNLFSGIDFKINKLAKIRAKAGVLRVKDNDNPYSQWHGELSGNLRLSAVHTITLGLRREQQDFNRNLLLQDLTMNHLYIRSNMYWVRSGLGWYSELYHTFQSDQNRRNLFFSSIYKNFMQELKGGINLQYISFQEQYPDKYYSPKDLKAVEAFVHLSKPMFKSKGVIDAEVAAGYKMLRSEVQPTFRTRVSLKRSLGQRWLIGTYGMYNASAERISNGFSFYGGGIDIKYRLAMKPLFYQKLEK